MPAAHGMALDLRRLTELSRVLARHGFGNLLQRSGLLRPLEKAGHILGKATEPTASELTEPERLRRALEEMGPTFVKLGQILSTRVDLFPAEFIAELEKLRDRVPTIPFEELTAEIEADTGRALSEVLEKIETEPLAAGSIAQVHRARLKSGEEVVLKIRRPKIRSVIEADLRLMNHVVTIVTNELPEIRRFRPAEILAEFSRSIRNELNLAIECQNAERIAKNFIDTQYIHVPKVYWDLTSEIMNVQSLVIGVPGSDISAVRAAGLDLKRLAARGADAVLQMILQDRYFHADPHGGNVFYLPGEELVFIDFGMVGYISSRRRDDLVDLLFGIAERRPEKVTAILLQWAGAVHHDNAQLENQIDRFIDRVHGVPLETLDLSELTFELIAIAREYDLALPPDLSLLIKAFVSLDGMGRQLDPGFDLVSAARPILQRLVLQRYTPDKLADLARQGLGDSAMLAATLPGDLRDLITAARHGQLTFGVEISQLDQVLGRLNRSMTHLTLGIVIGALTVGSSIVTAVSGADLPFGLEVFAMLGFFGAVIGGAWLLYSIWHEGRDR